MGQTPRVMEGNATDEVNQHEIEGRDDPQHMRYITLPDHEVEGSQRSILQPVSGNSERKMRAKAETRYGVNERSTNPTALWLLARKGEDEMSQFEE